MSMQPKIKYIYPLSPMQAGMLFHSVQEKSTAYFDQAVLTISGELDLQLFEAAYNQLIARYDVLRTVFIYDKFDQPQQVVLNERKGKIYYKDISSLPNVDQLVEKFTLRDQEKGFDLSKDLLLRISVLKTGQETYQVVWSHHHIIMDGWCFGFIMNDFIQIYSSLRNQTPLELPEPVPYKQFIDWLEKQNTEAAGDYWEKYLLGYDTKAVLPQRADHYHGEKGNFATLSFKIDEQTTAKLERLAQEQQVTMNTIIQSIWGILLQRYNNTEDIVFGSVVSGRNADVAGIESMIGLFINAIPVRVQTSKGKSYLELLTELQSNALAAGQYDYYPLAEIQSRSEVKNELIESMYVFKNFHQEEVANAEMRSVTGFNIEQVDTFAPTNYDFNIRAIPGSEVKIFFDYKPELYRGDFVTNMSKHFQKVAQTIATQPEIPVAKIDILPAEEKAQILDVFNDSDKFYTDLGTIHQVFEAQVEKTPDQIAIVYEDDLVSHQITFRELNQAANKVAHILREKGVKPDSIIGIMFDRSIEMFIGLMSVLKAGGAYFPIDPGLPEERIQYMLEDSQTPILLTQEHLKDRVSFSREILVLSDLLQIGDNTANPVNRTTKDNLAYILYTSGTTGRPKGVLSEHKNVVNFTYSISELTYAHHESDKPLRMACVAPYIFDMAAKAIYPALLLGNTLYVVPDDTRKDGDRLFDYYNRHQIDTSDGTPMHIQIMFSSGKLDTGEVGVKQFILGGDVLPHSMVKDFFARHQSHKPYITNSYGPTECCTDATCYLVHEGNIDDFKSIPIGVPMGNYRIYVFDKEMRLQPIGVPGEIYIAGEGVGRGYLHQEELTRQKFMENPFVPGMRMYRTGDLGRWLPEGYVDILGRADNQVKIRGFRIELGEVHNQLLSHAKVKEVGIVARTDQNNNKYICAYYVSDEELKVEELRDYLSIQLPHYMIPQYFKQVPKIPLTHNGKIDRRALPEPDGNVNLGAEYQPPRNPMEQVLVQAWEEILGVNQIGIDHNFFDLGGDSIKAMRLVGKLRQNGYQLVLKQLFQFPVIRELSDKIEVTDEAKVNQNLVTGRVELTPIQRYFFAETPVDPHHWNQSVMLYNQAGFDPEIVQQVFTKLVEVHDALRLVVKEEQGELVQYNRGLEGKLFAFHQFDLTQTEDVAGQIAVEGNRLQSSFDLSTGPLVKLALFKTTAGDHLLIIAHHLVIDGISWRILFDDFTTAYQQSLEGAQIKLPEKSHSFADWAQALQKYAASKELLRELPYWKQVEQAQVVALPKDQQIAPEENQVKQVRRMTVSLSAEETEALLKQTNQAYHTEINDLLLTALGMTLGEWTESEQVLVSLEGHGREPLGTEELDLSRTVGWFTSRYPVALEIDQLDDLATKIKKTKETLRQVPNKGIGYGILRYLTDGQLSNPTQPEVSFNYLGQFDQDIQSDVFQISNMPHGEQISGESQNLFALRINGLVAEGCLSMTFGYHQQEFTAETIEQVSNAFKENLLQIINHCQHQEVSERTPSDFGDRELSLEELAGLIDRYEGQKKWAIQEIYPLTPMQQGMLFHAIKDATGTTYCQQLIFTLRGELDLELFTTGFQQLLARYAILRTVFAYEGLRSPRQVVLQERKGLIRVEDLSQLVGAEQAEHFQRLARQDRQRGFDLSTDLLTRITVVKLSAGEYRVIWNYHHILQDGWCTGIITNDFFQIYSALKNQVEFSLPEPAPYRNFVRWLEEQDQEEAKTYWANYLEGYDSTAKIPTQQPLHRLESQAQQMQELNFSLDEAQSKGLEKLCAQANVTMNTIVQGIWGLLLHRYNNTDDVVYGAVVSGRNAQVEEIEKMVGLFINTIPVRVKSASEQSFLQLVKELQDQALESSKYDYYPLPEIQAQTQVKQELIDNILVFENYYIDQSVVTPDQEDQIGLKMEDVSFTGETNFNFSAIVTYVDQLKINFTYNSVVYDRSFVEKISEHFQRMVTGILQDIQIPVAELEILSPAEKEQLLVTFNETKHTDPQAEMLLHQLVEAEASRVPDQIALVFEEATLTYRELNERAHQLAGYLQEQGVKPESIVGLLADRSLEMIVGMLAILKAGGAYLPIDADAPAQRIEFMLQDSNAQILLTQKKYLDQISFDRQMIDLEDTDLYQGDREVAKLTSPANLAYVIYTSGSTGEPKGVMIEHRSVVNTLLWRKRKLNFSEQDATLQLASIAFDASISGIFTALISGTKLVLIPQEEQLNISYLKTMINQHQVTKLVMVPGFYQALLNDSVEMPSLQSISVAGESFTQELVHQHYRKLEGVPFYNEYGPTENAICTTCSQMEEADQEILIGRPIDNVKCYVLSQQNQLQPVGVAGELCVAGKGLARGYLNRPELTAEKFTENPLIPGERIYRTGDLVHWTAEGKLAFLGRIDQQVKIRGYRIELEEIANKLMQQPGVQEAVVVAQGTAEHKYLAGFVVAEEEMDVTALKAELGRELPDYMIPTHLMQLVSIPRTMNGKVDRKALPDLGKAGGSQVAYVAPRNKVEEQLAQVFAQVLRLDQVGVQDNFFELGGHSLMAMTLISSIHKVCNVKLAISELFKNPTVEKLAAVIQQEQENLYASIKPVEQQAYYPISSAQKRMYTLQHLNPDSIVYNMPTVLSLEGQVDPQKLHKVLNQLAQRHEPLRTSFESIDNQVVQRIHPEVTIPVPVEDCTQGQPQIAHQMKTFVQPFALDQGPLFRVKLLKLAEEQYLLLLDQHHIISDGVSANLLVRDFARLYQGESLQPLQIQYKDFAIWQNRLFESDQIKAQEAYWLERFSDQVPVLNLPYDFERPAVQDFTGDWVQFVIEPELTERLHAIASSTGSTLYMVLLAAFNTLLFKYTGDQDLVVGSPIAGRPHADLQEIMGMFVNILVLRSQLDRQQSFKELLREVKTTALEAYENQDYQFEELVDKLNLTRDLSRNPLFDVIFTMNNMTNDPIFIEDFAIKPYQALASRDAGQRVSKFDLELSATELDQEIRCSFIYATKLFKPETVQRLAQHFLNILEQVTLHPEMPLADLTLISSEEKAQLLAFNQNTADFSRDRSVYQIFEEYVATTPDRIALTHEGEEVTYGQLNAKANQLAHYLRELGVGEDQPIGILMERSPLMVESILAVWKAGGAYIPIDLSYPVQRVQGILQDSGAKVLLTRNYEQLAQIQDQFTGEIIDLNQAGEQIAGYSTANLNLPLNMDSLAYVIYTSGSTGKPKGAMVEHIGMMNHLQSKINELQLTEGCSVAQNASHCFDISVWQFFVALLVGGRTVIYPNQLTLDPLSFIEQVIQDQITILEVVPSFLSVMLDVLDVNVHDLSTIRYLLVTGEAVKANLVRRWFAMYPEIPMVNAYGPTEASDDITHHVMRQAPEAGNIPIGQPIQNLNIYIVDQDMNLVPIGVKGEICVSGVGVGRGYLNDPERTQLAFSQDPFVTETGVRLYKTGDLGRWLADGTIEFFGRKDYQVKIRGFRIELGEIESHLVNHPAIKEAVVIDQEDTAGNKYLSAYLVAETEEATQQTVSTSEIREYLLGELPEYMVPAYFLMLDQLPLNPNGKIDRKALPEIDGQGMATAKYVAPTNETEEKLAAIWAEALGLEQISITDSFFDLGGHSLKATFLGSKIFKEFKTLVPINEIFQYPTVKEMARRLEMRREYHRFQEEFMVLHNADQERKVFGMPPGIGWGLGYKSIASYVDTHAFYAFDFIEADQLYDRYLEKILEVQPEGPYTLFGYSAGGNMAFEMAKVLEEAGHRVTDVIILDSVKKDQAQEDHHGEEWYDFVLEEVIREKQEYAEFLSIEPIREQAKQKLRGTRQHYYRMINDGTIQAKIHFISSEGGVENTWGPLTTIGTQEYKGSGRHDQMMLGQNLEHNAKLIAQILQDSLKD